MFPSPARPLLLDGKMAGFYAGYHDISDRKRVEALSSALYRVAEKSSSAHDLQQFFAAVHGIVDELMYARNFYIALYDPPPSCSAFLILWMSRILLLPPKKLGTRADRICAPHAASRCWPHPRCLQAWKTAAKWHATVRDPWTGWASR